MYSYVFYGYLVYKAYEYVGIVESVISVGNGVVTVFRWISPPVKKEDDDYQDLDWILISEDSESRLQPSKD